MRRPAKILLAGTLAAIAPCGAATSLAQSIVLNEQVQLGDVFSEQLLDVVEITDQTIGVATATANTFDARVDGGDLDVTSYQELSANVTARAELTATVSSGETTTMAVNATGNVGDAAIYGGTMTAVITQVAGENRILAESHIEAPDAWTGDVASSVQALANSQGLATTAGSTGALVSQYNAAEVTADGGGVFGLVAGPANFSAAASGNNITSAAQWGASERIVADQNNDAPLVQAGQFTSFGSAYVAHTSATAAANNLSAGNEGWLLDVTAYQQNTAYVRAEAVSNAYQFGGGTSTAYGVGNSLLAGQLGEEVILDVEQFNTGGGVVAVASFTGHDGYDASASAMAMGNASTGYVCSDCEGVMMVSNRQTNASGVSATGQVSVTGTARSAVGSAHAVGNTASYYVSRPGE